MSINLSGYDGSPYVLVSIVEQEVIPKGYVFHKLAFYNFQECHIKINNSNEIYLAEGQGFSADQYDTPIYSFIIVDSGINFNWIGAFKNASVSK